MTDEIHERGLERAKRIVDAYCSAVTVSTTEALAAAFQAAGDALHAEADAATEQRKRGHQSLTKDLRNAAGRLVGIAQDLLELSKLDTPESKPDIGSHSASYDLRQPYTPATDPVTSDLRVDNWPREADGSPSSGTAEDVAAYLRGETNELPPDLTDAERLLVAASDDVGAEGAAQADVMTPDMPDPVRQWFKEEPIDAFQHALDEQADVAADLRNGGPVEQYDNPSTGDRDTVMLIPDLVFADPEPLRSSVRWLPPGDAERYVQTFADLAAPIDPAALPDHLSWSQLTTLEDCGVKYRLQRLQMIPQQPQWANIGGSAFHVVTEAFDRGAWQAGGADLLPEVHAELIKQRWRDTFANQIAMTHQETGIDMGPEGENYRAANGGKEGYTWWLIEGEHMLALYVHNRRKLDAAGRAAGQLRVPLEVNPSAVTLLSVRIPIIEYAYSRKIDGPTGTVVVEGVIDRAYRCADGSLLITDLKSGRLDPDIGQLGEYAWTLLELLGYNESHRHPDGPGITIRGNFYDARKGLFTDPIDLLAAHPHEEYVYRYHAAEAARRIGVFLPRRSSWCNGCSVKYACPVGNA
jgi:hypothetical protein